MENIYKNPIDPKKKISLDVHASTLEFIDKMACLTKASRTIVIEALVGKGMAPLMDEMKTTWNGLLIAGNLTEEKKKKVKDCLAGLEKLRKGR